MATKSARLGPLQKLPIAAALMAACLALTITPPLQILFDDLENRAQDYQFLLRGSRPTAGLPILIVFVDEQSLAGYRFYAPTPRKLLAEVVGGLNEKGVACIGLDFTLHRPLTPEQDDPLEAALAASKAKVVLVEGAIERFARLTIPARAEITVDSRNRAREVPLAGGREGVPPAFALAMYEACLGHPPTLPGEPEVKWVRLNFYGAPSHLDLTEPTFPVIAAHEVPHYPAEFLQGKMVLVGSGLNYLGDTFMTPFSTGWLNFRSSFGVELHATLLAMLLEGRFLLPAAPWLLAPLLVLLYGGMALGALFFRTGVTILLLVLLWMGWSAFGFWAFASSEITFPVVLPVFLLLAIFVVCQVILYLTETRHSRFLQRTFGRYLSPELVNEMVEKGWGLELGGESKFLTILFSDMEGFTALSERLSSNEVIGTLNEYFGIMTGILFEQKGMVGDYVGDAVMAYFGAPLEVPDHAARACECALDMQEALVGLNEDWARRGMTPISIRIGVHTGDVVMGNIGSEERRDFTIVGDTVNLTSRLEGVNKVFGTRIVVSEQTLVLTGGRFLTRELARIVVKGRTQPVVIHELLGRAGEASPPAAHTEMFLKDYTEALELFYLGEFRKAARAFKAAGKRHGDEASAFMEKECLDLARKAPGEGWNGALKMLSK